MRRSRAAGFSYRAATTLIPFCARRESLPLPTFQMRRWMNFVFTIPTILFSIFASFLPFFQLQGLRFCFSALFFHPLLPSFLHALGFKVLCSVSFFHPLLPSVLSALGFKVRSFSILCFLPFFALQGLRLGGVMSSFPSSASFLSSNSRV